MPEILRTTPVGDVYSEEYAFDDKFFLVRRLVITDPTGEQREQLVWDRKEKEFVVALAVNEAGEFILIEEPKYGQEEKMLTVPAGGINKKKGESPEQAASRELLEESGYLVDENNWIRIREGVVDFPDKVSGGKHTILFGRNARKVSEPEKLGTVKLFNREKLEKLIDNQIEEEKLKIAMSFVAIALVIRRLDVED